MSATFLEPLQKAREERNAAHELLAKALKILVNLEDPESKQLFNEIVDIIPPEYLEDDWEPAPKYAWWNASQ